MINNAYYRMSKSKTLAKRPRWYSHCKKYGGAFVSNKTLAQVFRILSKGDANVGQIPQNQISLLNLIEIMGTEQQNNSSFQKY